ncbi:MAG: pyridoxine 5'-phosphate synthase [Pirellulaceae bacterium]|nr:pyridoxine 5'-phosphate synthase [Pirellulaceae bacterium]
MVKLGVNIDHVATVRQARMTNEPDPIWAAALAELGGADGITVHLREDRRHILDRDLHLLAKTVAVDLNLEMAVHPEIVEIACQVQPAQVTLVPEKREEVTTEGGLDVLGNRQAVENAVGELKEKGIFVALFLDPVREQIDLAKELGVDGIELHTGKYALTEGKAQEVHRQALVQSGNHIHELEMRLHAGHGLTYRNIGPIASLPHLFELNIGHSIVSRALFVGLKEAVAEMKRKIVQTTR